MASTSPSYSPLRQTDLADPQLTLLNLKLQTLQGQVAAVSGANVWTDWVPNVLTSMSWTLNQIFEAKYLQEANYVLISLDIQGTLGGTPSDSLQFSLPKSLVPASNVANLMTALALNTGPTPAYARTQNNGLAVSVYSGTFAAGVCEILVSGRYRI